MTLKTNNLFGFPLISIMAILLGSLLTLTQTHADAQINRDSYSATQQFSHRLANQLTAQSTFNFEQHALAYSNSSWLPDSEISIDTAKLLKTILPSSQQSKSASAQHVKKSNTNISAINYQTHLSDKSFGVVIRYSF